jgi:hypothetical protein
MNDDKPAQNTDREIYRTPFNSVNDDSMHVTESGAIGINCGGSVFVMPLRAWHKLATDAAGPMLKQGRMPPAPPKLSVVPEEQRTLLQEMREALLDVRYRISPHDCNEACRDTIEKLLIRTSPSMNNGEGKK